MSAATADEYLHAFHDAHHELGWRAFAPRMVAAVATLGTGAPMGLEGPSLYAGATIGSAMQRRFPRFFRTSDRRLLLVAGGAAGVAAIFKAPATGAVFALEVPYRDDLARRMLLSALVASASGYLAFVAIHGTAALFPIDGNPAFTLRELFGAIAIGVLAGIGARGFAWMLRHAKQVAAGPRPLRSAVIAGVILAALFALGRLMTGQSLLIGSGYAVVAWASEPQHPLWVMVGILGLRCLATSATVAGGGVGGLFGVAAFLGAGYRVPLAAVMFVAETTGRPSFIVPGLLAAVAAELIMGPSSITKYQRDPRSVASIQTTAHLPRPESRSGDLSAPS